MFLAEREPEHTFSLRYKANEERKLLSNLVANAIVDIKPGAAPVRLAFDSFSLQYIDRICYSVDDSIEPRWFYRESIVEDTTEEVPGLPRAPRQLGRPD